jgi:hypothetical protein
VSSEAMTVARDDYLVLVMAAWYSGFSKVQDVPKLSFTIASKLCEL